jgi:acyl-CoA thioester hydrolase
MTPGRIKENKLRISTRIAYNSFMSRFHYFHPIEVRYGDLDPQGHVNNAKHLTYIEQARVNYVRSLGLWSGGSFLDIGFILADVHIVYKQPILFGTPLQVGVRVTRMGNKSLSMEYTIQNGASDEVFAIAETVQVAYDYHSQMTILIPERWRDIITNFEGLDISQS